MEKVTSRLRAVCSRYPVIIVVGVVSLFGGMLLASAVGTAGRVQATPAVTVSAGGVPQSFADLAEALGPTVVNIKVTKVQKTDGPDLGDFPEGPFGDMFKHFFGDTPRFPHKFKTQGAGSGVVIKNDGTVIT